MTRKRSSAEAEEPRVRDGGLRGSEPQSPSPAVAESGSAEATGPAPEATKSEADLVERLAQAEAQRDEYLDLLQRVKADFENYRKRAARDQERLVAHAHERIVGELIPVLDDLERAAKPPVRDSGPREGVRGNRVEVPPTQRDAPELHDELEAVRAGVQLVEKSLRKALEKEGLREIETDGPFDPHVHEAVLAQPRDGAEPGSVVEVLQRGYRLGDRVVRPARVIVAQ